MRWAVDVVAGFYSDEWFAANASRRSLPVMSLYDWPLSSPVALVRLIERATRIALLPGDVQGVLSEGPNGIRRSKGTDDFDHLDVVLEVVGLGVRDGWSVESEVPTQDGRLPDLRLTKGSMSYIIEVTTQGTDREFRAIDRQGNAVYAQQRAVEFRYKVECVTRESRLLNEEELGQFVLAMAEAARSTAEHGKHRDVDLGFASVVVYPAGERPEGPVHEGPMLARNLWPRFATRLREKAKATSRAGLSWIRIDESGGLLMLTPAVHWSLDQQLGALRHNVTVELSGYHHIGGVVISHGAEPDWIPQRREQGIAEPATGAVALERRLPGGRRRRTFVIPVHQRSGLVLPDRLVLQPARWYDDERRWLDWALNTLGQPSITNLVTGERARQLII
ncbi:MAG: hypothetical protein ACYDD4_05285 [Acidimicrobiales bacterium]